MNPHIESIKNKGTRLIAWSMEEDGPDGVRILQRTVRELGPKIAVDGELGPITAAAINSIPAKTFQGTLWDRMFGKEIALSDDVPVWVAIALKELKRGVREIHGARHNPRILEYMHATRWGKWVTTDETPWCAGFMAWLMVQAGFEDQIPDHALGALSWLEFGVSVHKPILGAIAVKERRSRKGKVIGGHVGLVLGRDKKRKRLWILGGNQDDMLCVKSYPEWVWKDYRYPKGVPQSTRKLVQWKGPSTLAGREV